MVKINLNKTKSEEMRFKKKFGSLSSEVFCKEKIRGLDLLEKSENSNILLSKDMITALITNVKNIKGECVAFDVEIVKKVFDVLNTKSKKEINIFFNVGRIKKEIIRIIEKENLDKKKLIRKIKKVDVIYPCIVFDGENACIIAPKIVSQSI